MPYAAKPFLWIFFIFSLFLTPAQLAGAAQDNTARPAKTVQHYSVGQKMFGVSAWYGKKAHGRRTASGGTFDSTKLTAAHRTLPFGTMVKVTNKKNNRHTVVKITDRGPTSPKYVIDISRQAAINIGMLKQGIADVTLEIVSLPSSYTSKRNNTGLD